MNLAKEESGAPNRDFGPHQLSDAIEICSELAKSKTISDLCTRTIQMVGERLNCNSVAICLSTFPPDMHKLVWGFDKAGNPIEDQETLKEIRSNGLHLLTPIVTCDGILHGEIITETPHQQNENTQQLPELLRLIATFLAVQISSKRVNYNQARENLNLRTLIDVLPNHIYIKDSKSRIILTNKLNADVCNDTPENMIGKTDFDFFSKEMAQKFYDDEQRIIHNGEPLLNFEEDCLDDEGNSCCILSSKIPVKNEDGQVISLMGIGVDITERKNAQIKLEESKERFQSLFQSIGDAIIAHDEHGRILDCNSAACDLFGLSADELLNESMASINLPEYQQLLDQGLEGKQKMKAEYTTAASDLLSLDIRISEFTYSGATAYLALMRDVTELEQAKLDAEAAAQTKSAFLANMSHEIRTPLNAVLGMTALLEDTPLNEEQSQFIKTIRTSGDSLLDIISDILDISKIEAGQMHLEQIPFSLRNCVEDALGIVSSKAGEKQLELTYGIFGDLPSSFIGDEAHLRQVLLNLLSNSIKFTQKGEVVVRITGVPFGDNTYRLNFSVSDTGIGMTQEQAEIIFNPFQQADESTTRNYGGTGLGLSISNRLVEMMGGEMGVKSKLGKGSEFSFNIYLQPAAEQEAPNHQIDPKELNGKRALIVDDNHTNLEILEYQLKKWGIEALCFVNGREALEGIENHTAIDFAILDMAMPEMDGLELAKHLRQAPQLQNKPIMILSSINKPKIIRSELIDAWLSKPTKFQLLESTLCSLVSGKGQTEVVRKQTKEIDHELSQDYPLRILVAEDNRVNQMVVMKLLQRLGYDADLVENGLLAVQAVRNNTYDVVLMDIQMPVMDGNEAARTIREEQLGKPCPEIIAITAHALDGDKERCMHSGMTNYVSKPVRLSALIEALKCVETPDGLKRNSP